MSMAQIFPSGFLKEDLLIDDGLNCASAILLLVCNFQILSRGDDEILKQLERHIHRFKIFVLVENI